MSKGLKLEQSNASVWWVWRLRKQMIVQNVFSFFLSWFSNSTIYFFFLWAGSCSVVMPLRTSPCGSWTLEFSVTPLSWLTVIAVKLLCLESLFIFWKAGNSPYLSHTVIQQNLLWRKGRRTPEGKLSGQDRSTWYMWTLFHRDSALACQNQAGDGSGEEKFLASESDLRVEPQSRHGCPLNLSR